MKIFRIQGPPTQTEYFDIALKIRRSDHDAFKGNECPYNCVVYHPEKDYIITGDWKGLLKIWDLTSLERKAILRGNKASIQDLKLAPDASIVISGDILGTVCVFNGKYLL